MVPSTRLDVWFREYPTFRSWLRRHPDPRKVRCVLCDVVIQISLDTVKRHEKSNRHEKSFKHRTYFLQTLGKRKRHEAEKPDRKKIRTKDILPSSDVPSTSISTDVCEPDGKREGDEAEKPARRKNRTNDILPSSDVPSTSRSTNVVAVANCEESSSSGQSLSPTVPGIRKPVQEMPHVPSTSGNAERNGSTSAEALTPTFSGDRESVKRTPLSPSNVIPSASENAEGSGYASVEALNPASFGDRESIQRTPLIPSSAASSTTANASIPNLMNSIQCLSANLSSQMLSRYAITTQISVDVCNLYAKVSLFMAEHSHHLPNKAAQHLWRIGSSIFEDHPMLVGMHFKYKAILKVLSSFFTRDLINDIHGFYSLLLDELPPVNSEVLPVRIVYFSRKKAEVVCTFLGLIWLDCVDAKAVALGVEQLLNALRLQIDCLRGIGSDNSNNALNINKTILQHLREKKSSLVQIRISSNSLYNAVSKASDKLPRCMNYLIEQTYKWFERSRPAKTDKYYNLYKRLFDDHDPKKVVEAHGTLWLSVESAVTRISALWTQLAYFFRDVSRSSRSYIAGELCKIYEDEKSHEYLRFLINVLSCIHRLMETFSADNVDPFNLFSEMKTLIAEINQLRCPETSVDVRNRCANFQKELSKQIAQRLPDNSAAMEVISNFSPRKAILNDKDPLEPLLVELEVVEEMRDELEQQWKEIGRECWQNVDNAVMFWTEVRSSMSPAPSSGQIFGSLARFVFSVLVLLYFDPQTESSFKSPTLADVKTKESVPLENDLLTIRSGLRRNRETCSDFELPVEYLQKIRTILESSDVP